MYLWLVTTSSSTPHAAQAFFLVEAYKRLVLHWRLRNEWVRPGIDDLRPLLDRVHGVDIEEGAIELAAFSLWSQPV